MQDFRPFRGNVFQTKERDNEGLLLDKYDIPTYDIPGLIKYLNDFQEQAANTMNETESELISTLISQAEEAKQLLDDDNKYEANIVIVEQSIEEIKGSDETVKIAPVLLKDYSSYIVNRPGELRYRETKVEENIDRRNYKRSDNINYLDGDPKSHLNELSWSTYEEKETRPESAEMYVYPGQGESTEDYASLINDQTRVYKGASWNDRAYWMVPGTRRFLDERQSLSTLGFRCAMDRVGSPVGLGGAR
jgi:hypothetical protein